jgi:hypothetical protein
MYVEDGVVRIDPDDQCASCQYFLKGVSCPLIEALGVGIVSLEIEVSVTNCGFYKEFKRHLQVIKTEAPEPEAPSDGASNTGKKPVKRAKKL